VKWSSETTFPAKTTNLRLTDNTTMCEGWNDASHRMYGFSLRLLRHLQYRFWNTKNIFQRPPLCCIKNSVPRGVFERLKQCAAHAIATAQRSGSRQKLIKKQINDPSQRILK